MADTNPNNRERLKEVHQSDLTEGRINQDFVDWLKTKGMTWLLVLMVAICAYLGVVRWRESRVGHQAEAWLDLNNASLPSAYEDVADKYPNVGAVAELARLRAAQRLLVAVQTSTAIGADIAVDPAAAQPALSTEDRASYLDRADRMYQAILAADDNSAGRTLASVTALAGRAAVAESKGDVDAARGFYEQASARAEASYPKLSQSIRSRMDGIEQRLTDISLPSAASVEATTKQESLQPATVDPWVDTLLNPPAASESDTSGPQATPMSHD